MGAKGSHDFPLPSKLLHIWVPGGSHCTSQVCCRTWFCKAVQCCAVERALDLDSGALSWQADLGSYWWGPSVSHFTSMSFHVLIWSIKELDQIICPSAVKTDVIPGKKKGINKGGRSEKKRIRKGPKNFSETTFCPSVNVTSLLPLFLGPWVCFSHLVSSPLPAYCFANSWPC